MQFRTRGICQFTERIVPSAYKLAHTLLGSHREQGENLEGAESPTIHCWTRKRWVHLYSTKQSVTRKRSGSGISRTQIYWEILSVAVITHSLPWYNFAWIGAGVAEERDYALMKSPLRFFNEVQHQRSGMRNTRRFASGGLWIFR